MTVDNHELAAILTLLVESKRLHEGGWSEAHKKSDEALSRLRALLLAREMPLERVKTPASGKTGGDGG